MPAIIITNPDITTDMYIVADLNSVRANDLETDIRGATSYFKSGISEYLNVTVVFEEGMTFAEFQEPTILYQQPEFRFTAASPFFVQDHASI